MSPAVEYAPGSRHVAGLAPRSLPAQQGRGTIPAHYWITLLALATLLPALRLANLPIRFTWADYLKTYWLILVGESVFGGTIMYLAGAPIAESLGRFCRRYAQQKLRLLLILPLAAILMMVVGIVPGLELWFATVVILEVKDRAEEDHIPLSKIILDFLWPAVYLFAGLVIVFGYNDVVASLRYDGSADFALKRWDAILLGGHSVSGFAHWFLARWPGTLPVIGFFYFAMFAQIGGCLAILALSEGRRRAAQFVGTIITAYCLALVMFFLWPATGPYASCPDHFSRVPNGPAIYSIQQYILARLEQFRSGAPLQVIGRDYFIALPCMHLVQPLIVLWFVRRWKRMMMALIVFDVLMVPCILLLEQHYLVDLIAAVPVALLAMAMTDREVASFERGVSASATREGNRQHG
jgi:PAP2 superfamily